LHGTIFDKYLRYQMLVLTYRGADAVLEHKTMFDAALARDTTTAKAALETHIRLGLDHTLAAMAELSD
jgi:DNA-binding GntR family transcriptional regulator